MFPYMVLTYLQIKDPGDLPLIIQLVAGCLFPTLVGTIVSQFFLRTGTPPETRAEVQDGAVLVAERREGVVEVWGFSSVWFLWRYRWI